MHFVNHIRRTKGNKEGSRDLVFNAFLLFDVTCMRRSPKSNTDDLFIRANNQAEAGNPKAAFRLYLAAAKAGDTSCR